MCAGPRRPPPPDPAPTPASPTPAPAPTPAPGPTPGPGVGSDPGRGHPGPRLSKQQTASTGGPQPTLTFRMRVTNRSQLTATRVVVADRLPEGMALVSVRSSSGRCITRGPRLAGCALGDLAPGQSATVQVRARQLDAAAARNVAVVGSGSPEQVLAINIATVSVAGVQAERRPPACPSRARAVARAAC